MPFSESIKQKVKKQAHFKCCLCQKINVEIHHIIPQEENGPDTEYNAAPLCPSCHETYGANPTKRKLIREARDNWYEICKERFAPVHQDLIIELKELIQKIPSQEDFHNLKNEVIGVIKASNSLTINHDFPISSVDNNNNFLSIEKLLARIFIQESQKNESFFDFIFDEVCWAEEEMLEIREEFLCLFGEQTARKICINALDKLNLDLHEGFMEEEFVELLNSIHVEAILLVLCSEGKIKARIDEAGQVLWSANDLIQSETQGEI